MRQFVIAFVCVFVACASYGAACPENQYLADGVCANCIYNATCDGQNYKCNDGFYDDGNNQCMVCPQNSICTSPTEFTCMPGAYLSGGVCNACPDNATCDGGVAPFHCNAGYYKYQNQCMSCAGHVCDGDVLQSCGAGFVRYPFGDVVNPYKQYCLRCSGGYYCPAGTTRYICDTGFFKNGNGTCAKCPAEYYCPRDSTIDNMYDYCSPGYYRAGNSCTKCDDNIECPGGVNIECSIGLIAHSNGQCLPYAENDPGLPGACNPGYYDAGAQCAPCPNNSTCAAPDDFQCKAGFYKNGAACDICPDNSQCPAASTQITCMPGYWLNGNACDACGADAYCHDNIRYPCPQFDPDNFALSDEGSVVVSWGLVFTPKKPIATKPENCVVSVVWIENSRGKYGLFWPNWSVELGQYYSDTKHWKTAATGYYLSGVHNLNSEVLYYDNLNCTNAPANAIYTGAGTPDGNDCPWRCNDGYFRDGDICTVCPSNLECRDGKIVCPIGQYASGNSCLNCPEFYDARSPENVAPQSINECQIKCDVGTYLSDANGTQCVSVGTEFWNPTNYTYYGSAGIRNQCPDNLTTIGYGAGADDAGDCGKTLHIGKYTLHLRSHQLTHPSLAVQYDGRVLYGDMSSENRGHLRVEYKGSTYSVFNTDID